MMEYVSMERGTYKELVGNNCYSRHSKNMSPIEKRYVEAILDEAIGKHGIGFTIHSEKRMKERKLSKGRIQMAVRQGVVQEVQFNADGVKILISFATGTQLGKGYLNYVAYDLNTGRVVSVFNKQKRSEERVQPELYSKDNKEYILEKNCITMLHNFLNMKPTNEEMVRLIRKYDNTNMDTHSEKKLQNFRMGRTTIEQL